MSELIKNNGDIDPTIVMCDPERCPMADKCPVGPVPNLPCKIKKMFMSELNDQLALSFKNIDEVPEVRLRVNIMLKPLFDQLLDLQMARLANPEALFGTKANPLMKEIRQVIQTIDKVFNETVRLYNQGPEDFMRNKKEQKMQMADHGYYEMLVLDGQASVEERKGIEE